MTIVKEVQDKVNDLASEHASLSAAVDTLDDQHRKSVVALDLAYATSERSGTPQATQHAGEAESCTNALEAKYRRKLAAMVECGKDLDSARLELVEVEHLARVEELLDVHAELAGLCETLQDDMLNVAGWQRLIAASNQGNRLYMANWKAMPPPFVNGANATSHIFTAWRDELLNSPQPVMLSVSAVLELPRVGRRLEKLKKSGQAEAKI